MTPRLNLSAPQCLTLIACLALFAQAARAAEVEQRDFAVLLDGKESGHSRMLITVENDGSTVVVVSAKVELSRLFFNYSYKIDSTESWKDGKLTSLKANTVENGKRTEVGAGSDGNRLVIRLNGAERAGSLEVWTSTFWKLADPRFHNKSIPVLEPDSGKEYTGQLQFVGTEQLTLLNQPQSCYHFRVTGGPSPVDLWFDRYHRLVRQEFMDSGYKTIMQLVALKR